MFASRREIDIAIPFILLQMFSFCIKEYLKSHSGFNYVTLSKDECRCRYCCHQKPVSLTSSGTNILLLGFETLQESRYASLFFTKISLWAIYRLFSRCH